MTDQFKELVKNNKIEEIHNYLNNDEITTLDEYDLKVLFMSFLSITITFNSCEIFKILISKCNDLLIPLSVIQNIAEKGNYCKLLYDTLYEMESRKDSIIENRANNEYEISISNKTTKLCRFSYLSEIKMTDHLEIQKIIIDKIITTNIELFNFKSFNFENLYNYGPLELINYIKDKLRQSININSDYINQNLCIKLILDDIDKFENKLETILDTINAFNFDVLCFLIEKLTLYKTNLNGKWVNILDTFHYNQRYYFNKIWTNENELNNQLIRTKDEYVINLLFDKFLHINEFDFADCSVVCYLLTILCCTDNFKLIKYHMEKLFHNTNDAERYNYNRNIIYFLFINSMDVYDTIYGVYNINCRYLNANIILFDYFNKYNILVGGKLNQYNNNYKQLLELMIIDEEIDFSIIKNVESSHMNMKIKDNNYINWISGLIITNRKSFNNFEYVLQLVNDNYTINRDFRGCYQFYLMLFNICDGAECRDSYKVKLQLIRFMIDLINNKYINANYHNFRLLYEICHKSSARIRNEFSNAIINNYEEIIKLNSNKIGNSKINVILNGGNGIDFDFVQTMLRHLFYGQIINHHIKNPMDFGVGLPVIDNDYRYFSYNYPNYVKEAIFTLIAIYKIEKEEKNIVGNDLSQSLSYLPNELFEEICKLVEYNYLLYLLV